MVHVSKVTILPPGQVMLYADVKMSIKEILEYLISYFSITHVYIGTKWYKFLRFYTFRIYCSSTQLLVSVTSLVLPTIPEPPNLLTLLICMQLLCSLSTAVSDPSHLHAAPVLSSSVALVLSLICRCRLPDDQLLLDVQGQTLVGLLQKIC